MQERQRTLVGEEMQEVVQQEHNGYDHEQSGPRRNHRGAVYNKSLSFGVGSKAQNKIRKISHIGDKNRAALNEKNEGATAKPCNLLDDTKQRSLYEPHLLGICSHGGIDPLHFLQFASIHVLDRHPLLLRAVFSAGRHGFDCV